MKKTLIVLAVLAAVVMAGTAMAAGNTTVAVSATVLGRCAFNAGGSLGFGNLDPTLAPNVPGVPAQPTFWCTRGTTYTITDDNGLNESGVIHRMLDAVSGDFIPYSFTYTASATGNGKTNPITMDIAGTVLGTDYENASEGSYTDTVTLTINP